MALKLFADESGHSRDPDEKTVTIGGVIAPLDKWDAFEPEWDKVLSDFGISALHMTDFAQSNNEFEKWRHNKHEPERRAFISRLMNVLLSTVTGYVAATMPLSEWDKYLSNHRRVLHDPYYPCFMAAILAGTMHARDLGEKEKVQFVFERTAEFSGRAESFVEALKSAKSDPSLTSRIGPTSHACKFEARPLQAADLVAYEMNLHLRRIYETGEYPANDGRWPFRQIPKDKLHAIIFDAANIKRWLGGVIRYPISPASP